MEGARLSADDVKQVSKWPSRTEQLSLLIGQILSPGMTLYAQLLGPGAKLAISGEAEGRRGVVFRPLPVVRRPLQRATNHG